MEGCSQTAIEVIGMDAHSRKLALCLVRREGGKLVKVKTVATTLDALEGTYRKQMPSGALTGHACARSRTADIRVRHPAALKTVHAQHAIVRSEAPTPFD